MPCSSCGQAHKTVYRLTLPDGTYTDHGSLADAMSEQQRKGGAGDIRTARVPK